MATDELLCSVMSLLNALTASGDIWLQRGGDGDSCRALTAERVELEIGPPQTPEFSH